MSRDYTAKHRRNLRQDVNEIWQARQTFLEHFSASIVLLQQPAMPSLNPYLLGITMRDIRDIRNTDWTGTNDKEIIESNQMSD